MTQDQDRENFKYKHAKSAWLSAGEDLLLLAKLVDIGLAKGHIDDFMLEGRYSLLVEQTGPPPSGQSDFRSLVPLTYQIYNSIEMLMKGFEYAAFPHERLTAVPKFAWLLARFEEQGYAQSEPTIRSYVRKYTNQESLPPLLRGFLQASGLSVEHLMSTRRYINNNNFFTVVEKYKPYYYDPQQGQDFFTEVDADVRPVLAKTEQLFANIDDDGNPGELVRGLQVTIAG